SALQAWRKVPVQQRRLHGAWRNYRKDLWPGLLYLRPETDLRSRRDDRYRILRTWESCSGCGDWLFHNVIGWKAIGRTSRKYKYTRSEGRSSRRRVFHCGG